MTKDYSELLAKARKHEHARRYRQAAECYAVASEICNDAKRSAFFRERIKFCELAALRIDALIEDRETREKSVYDYIQKRDESDAGQSWKERDAEAQ